MKINRSFFVFGLCALIMFSGFTIKKKGPKLHKIFNGKNLDGWKAPDGNIWWTANKGILTVKSGPDKKGSILWADGEYEDFIVQLDFKFGAGTVDSGIFLRTDKQEIQIGESGSLKRDLTGALYSPGKGYVAEASNVEELLKLDDWNTMKVKAQVSVYTIWLNGEKVLTYDSETAIDKGPVGLQLPKGREMHIDFRNILFTEI